MEERAKKTVHITWIEAQRAEAEREQLRQARYHPISTPSLTKVIAAHLAKELPKIKAYGFRVWQTKFH